MEQASNQPPRYFIGIDCASGKFDAAWLKDTTRFTCRNKNLPNSAQGCIQLLAWIRKNITPDLHQVHIVMETTGVYHEMPAYFLHDQGATVSTANPAKVHSHIKSLDTLHKTDKADSQAIARFAYERRPEAWQPEPRAVRQLKAKLDRLDTLQADLLRENNRLHAARVGGAPDEVIFSIHDVIHTLNSSIETLKNDADDHIDRHPELKDDITLLQSIPSVGKETPVRMATLYRSKRFAKPRRWRRF